MPWNKRKDLRKVNINGSGLGVALTGGPELANNPTPDSAMGEAQDELAQTKAEQAGRTYAPKAANYPKYKQPGFWSTLVNPQGANEVTRFNNESDMKAAEDVAASNRLNQQLSNEKTLAEHNFKMNGVLNKMINDGQLNPEQVMAFKQHYNNTTFNDLQTGDIQSGEKLNLMQQEPEKYSAGYAAELAKQGYINKNLDVTTQTGLAKLPYVASEAAANVDQTLASARAREQQTDQALLEQPYAVNLKRNQSIQSGMIRIPQGEVVGNVPSSIDGQTVDYRGVTPEIREDKGGMQMVPDPTDPSKFIVSYKNPVAAKAPSLVKLGPLGAPLGGNITPSTNTVSSNPNDPYEYKIDPVTGQKFRRLKQQP